MKTQKILFIWTLLFGLVLSTSFLSAQNNRSNHKASKTGKNIATTTATIPLNADSLQNVIDSLQRTIAEMKGRFEEQQQALEQAHAKIDSLRQNSYCDMTYVLNYGNALLYRQYHARAEDIAKMLANAPDSLKQKIWEQTLTLAREMINSSDTSVDIRDRVYGLLEQMSPDKALADDIRAVLIKAPDNPNLELSLTQQAISLIDAMPKSVTESNDLYATIKELLEVYPKANEEIKSVLRSIQNDPYNNIRISEKKQSFINQIKATDYYKSYYSKSWNIPYLNSIIDQALARLKNATSRVDLQDLIREL